MNARNDIKTKSRTNLGRRGFLQASGGLFVAFNLFGDAEAVSALQPIRSVQTPPPEGKLYAWLAVHPDSTATLFTGKVDVGTGTKTALAQIAAEELDISVDRLAVVMGNTSDTVDQGPSYGSRTVRYAGPQIRQAAAAGRAALLDLAADLFKTKASSLSVKDGVISDLSGQSISYGDLVAGKQLDMRIGATGTSFAMKVAPQAKAKDPNDYTIIGQSVARKDIPGKITAEFNYIQDVKVPGMLHGRVVRPYGVQAKLESVDVSAVKGIPGFVKLVRLDNFLGVVCETEWAAIQAAAKLGSVLHPTGPDAYAAKWSKWDGLPKMDKIWDVVRDAPGTTAVVINKGSVDKAMAAAKKTLKATFRTPFQMHGSIGPSCAVADVGKDRAIFWSGTQMPHEARRDMAKLLGMKPEQIELRWFEAAGAYGRNGLEHAIADAALMSQSVGKPVRVQWMRWDEHGWEPKGPPIAQDLEAAIDDSDNITAWRHKMWIPTFLDNTLIAAELIGRPDIVGTVGHGLPAITYAYQFENADVACHGDGRVALRTAWLRSPAQYETTFAMETFIDELAAETGQDPLAFRLKYLKDQRAIDVLKAAAKQYGWEARSARGQVPQDGKLAKGRGIAWVNRDDSRVATIADVTVDPSNGTLNVDRVVVAHDCGLVVNPNGLRNQVEGNVIQSISRSLHEEVTFDHSHVTSRDWIGYPILRFKEVPDSIEVVIVNNDPKYPMYGAGEPSTCPTAAVISSAVYDAVGIRLRDLPFRPNKLKDALNQA